MGGFKEPNSGEDQDQVYWKSDDCSMEPGAGNGTLILTQEWLNCREVASRTRQDVGWQLAPFGYSLAGTLPSPGFHTAFWSSGKPQKTTVAENHVGAEGSNMKFC